MISLPTHTHIHTHSQLKSECPKPPLSAYMLFCKAKREKVHKKHPKLAAKEVTMKLSKKWKSMEEDEKVHYVKYGTGVDVIIYFSVLLQAQGQG